MDEQARTIPEEMRRHLEDVLPLARGLMEEAEFAGLISNMRRHEAQARIDIVREWLDNLPQPPQPVYSHRNGETEPPEVEGYYWFQWEDALSWLCVEVRDAGYDNEMSLVALWPGLQTPDYIDSIVGRWYGPIPEPTQESNAA